MEKTLKIISFIFYGLLAVYCIAWLLNFYDYYNIYPMMFVHELNFIAIWVCSFLLSKQLLKKYMLKLPTRFPVKLCYGVVVLIICHVPVHLFNAELQSSDGEYTFQWRHLVHVPFLEKNYNILLQIILIFSITWLTLYVSKIFQKQGKKAFVKLGFYTLGLVLIASTALAVNHYNVEDAFLNYEEDPNSIKTVLSHPDLKGKYLYVDFWHSGCKPCIEEFQVYENFKASLPQDVLNQMEFVFIGVDRSTPGESEKQKFIINKYNIDAKHYFIDKSTLFKWWGELNPSQKSTPLLSYYYLIDKSGNVIINDGPKLGKELENLLYDVITNNKPTELSSTQ